MVKLRSTKIYQNQGAGHWGLPYLTLFKKTKRGLELIYLPHFFHDF